MQTHIRVLMGYCDYNKSMFYKDVVLLYKF